MVLLAYLVFGALFLVAWSRGVLPSEDEDVTLEMLKRQGASIQRGGSADDQV
jgi:hypothetical protein